MGHLTTTTRTEAERLLAAAEKLLRNRDLIGSRDFAILAQETEPLLDGSDQILAVVDVLSAAENKKSANNQPELYSILQIPQRTEDTELIKKQYRRLALLLHPDKNRFPFSDSAFRLVSDAWKVLSDPDKKRTYDNEFASRYVKVDLVAVNDSGLKRQWKNRTNPRNDSGSNQKFPVRRSGRNSSGASASNAHGGDGDGVGVDKSNSDRNASADYEVGNFWTACPYCYNLFEFPKVYSGCCVRCDNDNCKRAFTASQITSMPPLVPGKDAYYCCWGFFPMGFVAESVGGGGGGAAADNGVFWAKWMPPLFGGGDVVEAMASPPAPVRGGPVEYAPPTSASGGGGGGLNSSGTKRRGRPKKTF